MRGHLRFRLYEAEWTGNSISLKNLIHLALDSSMIIEGLEADSPSLLVAKSGERPIHDMNISIGKYMTKKTVPRFFMVFSIQGIGYACNIIHDFYQAPDMFKEIHLSIL